MRLTFFAIALWASSAAAVPIPLWPITLIAVYEPDGTVINDQVLWDIRRNGVPLVESSYHIALNQLVLQDDPVIDLVYGTYVVTAYGPAQDIWGQEVFEVSQQALTVTVVVTPRSAD